MSGRVLLHVGTPKTGTSYLQDVLFRNRAQLEPQGIRYAADRFDAHFLAALDLMRLTWGGLETQAVGAWDRLAASVREWDGTSIISHEILSTASPTQVARALESFGGAEVHLVLSVRDLVRQIPAEWQENVKHRSLVSYARFLEIIADPGRDTRIGSWFWGAQEIPDILDRWGSSLPPSHVHVVTVPPPGAPRDELWRRFSRTFGLDGLDLDLTPERANPSLGVPETALLRLVNKRVVPIVDPPDYRPLVRELLAHQTLSRRTDSARLGLPPEKHAWAQDLSRAWGEEITRRGYDVVGDVADLVGPPPGDFVDPDTAPADELLPAALDAISALLVEGSRLRAVEAELHRELDEARAALERSYLRPSYRLREKAVHSLETSAPGRGALGVYRRLRGRSSRSA
ncbi:hypothetical protein DDE18_12365 [Nocardioides gansuensis]|uniref:Sulfotransferase family protein n=1 Tax=Nocardioides gansuensis TaxID=2138300 RepID=A0A2T8F977_9ACTN|nr:hypothetical protein [Nocardioides gansuensis]PVG82284.1 hypothetical protein DDE18_12365 [Nocardioides gansuensis]